MKITEFLKDRIVYLGNCLMGIGFMIIFLKKLSVNKYAIIFLSTLFLLLMIISIGYDYLKRKIFYDNLFKEISQLKKTFLLSEIIQNPNFLEGKYLYKIIKLEAKSINDELTKHKIINNTHLEYIKNWAEKIIKNNNINDIKALSTQALFYSKGNSIEKEYVIKKLPLKLIVNEIIETIKKDQKRYLKLYIDISNNLYIYCDKEWLNFILFQILNYLFINLNKKDKILNITSKKENGIIILNIYCNDSITDKKTIMNFLYNNYSNIDKNSDELNFYICSQLCKKLGLGFQVKLEKGTQIDIIFKNYE